VDHVLTDGKGLQMLLEALLMDEIDHLPYETIDSILRLEDTVDLNPSLPPSPVYAERPWPSHPVIKSPTTCPPVFSLLHLSSSLLDRLKRAGKVHDTPTLHPILILSLVIALWANTSPSKHPTSILHATPVSVRNALLKHGYCTGNYTAVCLIRQAIHAELDFWAESRIISQFLRSPEGRDMALSAKGQLRRIPDVESSDRSPEFATGWEEFFLTKARSDHPYGSGLGLSNLGYMKRPRGAEDITWSQTASPFAPALLVCAISCEGGMRAVGGWRDGSVLRRDDVKEIESLWEKILLRLTEEPIDRAHTVWSLIK
jgi:hypothetical protein